jgi:hypothetical protein
MNNDTGDARAPRTDTPRRVTMEGRSFGNVSYAAEVPERTDDMRRRTTGSATVDAPAPRTSTEQRDTGARKRVTPT